jgi:acetylornithine deacetylase
LSRLTDAELLALHRALVAVRSVSGEEAAITSALAHLLATRALAPRRIGDSLLVLAGDGPLLLFDTHVDTVPPAPGWSRDPFAATVESGRVYGLGANDAKASVAAMTAAFVALAYEPLGVTLGLALVAGEETRSQGTKEVLDALAAEGRPVAAAVFGEPTGLDLAVAQTGLMVLELTSSGDATHAAHAEKLGARNAARFLARDLVALERVDRGPAHPELGPTTIEPTLLAAGSARNVVPATASAILDVRTTPASPTAELVARLRAAIAGEIRVLSDRFAPRETAAGSALVAAALAARPEARRYGSATLSDWALLPADVPGLKLGPGLSERSHTPDEFVLEAEIVAGARTYEALAREFALRIGDVKIPAEGAA